MLFRSILLYLSVVFATSIAFSQKEANIWYFGANAGLNFNSGKPVPITNSKLLSTEGCATQNNQNGRLLFYSDGVSVWDSTHTLMPNGTNLKGSSSSSQSIIILQKPFSFTQYYIFCVDNVAGAEGITYSEVNMKYNNGKGDINKDSKNKLLLPSVCEKITAVKHANGVDYWLIVHKFNTDLIYAYRLSSRGLIRKPVISSTGVYISGAYANTLGYMKFSPDGRKVAYANYAMDTTAIGDFDASSGKVSNVWTVQNDDAYGIEFSPKSKYLYVGEFSTKKIFQYDAKATSSKIFVSSKTLIASGYSNDLGALQLGPDGKIYIAVTGSSYLQVINYPDSFGPGTHAQKDYVFLGGRTVLLGLPNFNTTIFNKKTITVKRNCLRDSATFSISNTNDIDSVRWYFGDPVSGSANVSKSINNVFHIYNKTGYYTTTLIYYYKNRFEVTSYKFYVKNPKPFIGSDTGFCNSFSMTLISNMAYPKYNWSTGENTKSITVSKKGQYTLTINDSNECISSDTILIKNPTVKADFTISDTSQCAKNNLFELKDISNYDDDFNQSSKWEFGDGSQLFAPSVKKEYAQAGRYKIKLIVESKSHCFSSVEKSVNVIVNPVAQFSATSPCFPEGVQFTNQSSISTGKIIAYLWNFGDKTDGSEMNPKKFYQEPNKYNVALTVISDNGCTDSITKHRGVWVRPKPIASFNYTEVSSLNNGKRVIEFHNLSSEDVLSNYWDLGKGKTSTENNPTLNYLDSGMNIFTLKVTNDAGCKDTFTITTYHKFYFFLPNAFSPDANNTNETFGPVSSLYVSTYKMEIFNKWGEKLFETKDLAAGWDGTSKGKPCPDGIYICKIELTPYNESSQKFEEVFNLIR